MQKIDFGISLWGCTTEGNINRVQRLQNRAARHILKNYDFRNTRGFDLVKTLGLESVTQRRDYYLTKLVFEATRGFAPQYLNNLITMKVDTHDRNTRSRTFNFDDVDIPLVKKDIFRNSFLVCGGKLWNGLPADIKKVSSVDSFKRHYKAIFRPISVV